MDSEAARALVAGFLAGMTVAFATTAIVLVSMSRSEAWRRYAATRRGVPLPLIGVVVVNFTMLAWTAVGLLLGAAYLRAESRHPEGGLASANWLFTALVAGGTGLVLVLATVVRGRLTRPMGAVAVVAAAAFGWMLPGLAR